MKPGDRVIWLHSPGRSFLSGWRVQLVPGMVVRVRRQRIRIRVQLGERDKCVFCIYLVLIFLLIPVEEDGLREAYGEQYVAYQQKARRLIPFVY